MSYRLPPAPPVCLAVPVSAAEADAALAAAYAPGPILPGEIRPPATPKREGPAPELPTLGA